MRLWCIILIQVHFPLPIYLDVYMCNKLPLESICVYHIKGSTYICFISLIPLTCSKKCYLSHYSMVIFNNMIYGATSKVAIFYYAYHIHWHNYIISGLCKRQLCFGKNLGGAKFDISSQIISLRLFCTLIVQPKCIFIISVTSELWGSISVYNICHKWDSNIIKKKVN